ncbi:MAG TPA: hypothetical protein VK094_04130 [Pseudogracilibacillus sp.]|nr:hypothetical protein [Pseudogracilibacillus sp.]
MTIKQYEILRNRLDGILGSKASADLKVKRLLALGLDVLDSFQCKFATDLHEEIMHKVIQIDVDSNSIWGRLRHA